MPLSPPRAARALHQPAVLAVGVVLLGTAPLAAAQAPRAADVLSAGSLVQMGLGLLLVLALVLGAARLARRFSNTPGAAGGALRVIGGAAVGQRERVVLIELGDTWLVLGVAPGRVNALHTLPKTPLAPSTPSPSATSPFARWLRQLTERGAHG